MNDEIRNAVLQVIRNNPGLGKFKNYAQLCIELWKLEGLKLEHVPIYLTSPESITRCFRKLVEENVIKLTEIEIQERKDKEYKYRAHYSAWTESSIKRR